MGTPNYRQMYADGIAETKMWYDEANRLRARVAELERERDALKERLESAELELLEVRDQMTEE